MKTKKVNRYYCDFCKKSGGSSYHMKEHEKHCTMNPDRQCRMCEIAEVEPLDIAEIIPMLPKASAYTEKEDLGPWGVSERVDFEAHGKAVMAFIKDKTLCPACTLAILRQGKIESVYSDIWDYKEASRKALEAHKQQRIEHY